MFGGLVFGGGTFGGGVNLPISGGPPVWLAGITIDGAQVRPRVRIRGLTIHDILNDAPNTCQFVMDGDGPAVGQRVRITLSGGALVLFAGPIQSVEQTFDLQPDQVCWKVQAIDDTMVANYKRPFGTWTTTSATTIAQAITAQCTPSFSTAGIEANLPTVSMVFDGTDTFIAAMTRLATAVGGYAKVEDATVYLFLTDPGTPVDPVDEDRIAHPFSLMPQVRAHVDSSQLRTRVYGKGYGETLKSDVTASDPYLPIENGANFPTAGTLIAGTVAEAAQSQRFTYTGIRPRTGGSLVGPGSSPAGAPALAPAGGTGVTSGRHDVSVVFVTALGSSLAGPIASVDIGTVAPPGTAPVAATAVAGTGPDQGSHDYAASFVMAFGETIPSPISNAITTSAAQGQVPRPSGGFATAVKEPGNLAPSDGSAFDYRITFVTAKGETEGSPPFYNNSPGFPLTGQGSLGWTSVTATTGGNLTPGGFYRYFYSFLCANGFETGASWIGADFNLGTTQNAIRFDNFYSQYNNDPRVTKVRLYRTKYQGGVVDPPNAQDGYLVQEFAIPFSMSQYTDGKADSALGVLSSQTRRGPDPGYQVDVTNIPLGPAGVTARKIYRGVYPNPPHYLATINNNTTTVYRDNIANNDLNADLPPSNTTGTAVQVIPVSAIPLGPPGTTARKLYRRFNGAGTFKLVTTLGNNTATTFNDSVTNANLGAAALGTPTAIGNQIAVSSIPIGAGTVTSRELYMSPAGGGTRRKALVIANNTDTTATITISDAALAGAATEPASDASGLQQPQGQVNPGATVLPVAANSPFYAAGGWVELGGDQVVRYTGVSGQTLIGIPASGPGAIQTTILYGSQAVPAPTLTGCSARALVFLKGSSVHIWTQRDDLQAQAEQAARAGGDGVVEYVLVDQRRGLPSLEARCDAELKLFARPIVTVSYDTRDVKTKSGKLVTINLTRPAIHEQLTIQEVTITEMEIAEGLMPRFSVRASSVRFSLEDTLRRLVAGGLVVGGST